MPEKEPSGKVKADFFAAVRERGLINSMMDIPKTRFEEKNPGQKGRWEYSPPGGDQTMVVAREAMGFRVVDSSEVFDEAETPSAKFSGPVRVGDMILMAADDEIVEAIRLMDEKAAADELEAPERAYRESLKETSARTKDGEMVQAEPLGRITKTEQMVGVPSTMVEQ